MKWLIGILAVLVVFASFGFAFDSAENATIKVLNDTLNTVNTEVAETQTAIENTGVIIGIMAIIGMMFYFSKHLPEEFEPLHELFFYMGYGFLIMLAAMVMVMSEDMANIAGMTVVVFKILVLLVILIFGLLMIWILLRLIGYLEKA